ncbi:hypothetical protein [Polyangium aurulentum]|uniref:hypothetical protein n=1 Tax=Polyangium aurulentum TaxID=2567896 RepID=UPI0010AEA8FA|nr:hypothetical protein [Polyangium aurulentum]UQA63124.1 hypothetical protein E8A73_022740 [Polyangium aurulentum]
MRSIRIASTVLGLAVAACSGEPSERPPPKPASDVTGTLVDTHVTETGDVLSVPDASLFDIVALVPDGSGGWAEILGELSEDGSFRIPAVPEGAYYLRIIEAFGSGTLAPRYIVTSERSLDLGRVYAGRADVEGIDSPATQLILDADGLAPWGSNDKLEIFSLGAGASGALVPAAGTPPPAQGATSLNGYAVDLSQLVARKRIDGGAGDRAYITQSIAHGTPNMPGFYSSVGKVLEPAPFTVVEGQAQNISGSFEDVPQKTAAISFDVPAFEALVKAVHSTATMTSQDFALLVEPGGAERATATVTPTLLHHTAGPGTPVPALEYGNPFPSGWAEVSAASFQYAVVHTLPGNVTKTHIESIGVSGPPSEMLGAALKPTLGPPLDVTIADEPTTGTIDGVGVAPMVRWSPPSLGTPAIYTVTIRRLDPMGGLTRTVASFWTSETSLAIPPGLMAPGSFYYVRVGTGGQWNPKSPFKRANASAFAAAVTGVVSP